jgi:hypothetical protein
MDPVTVGTAGALARSAGSAFDDEAQRARLLSRVSGHRLTPWDRPLVGGRWSVAARGNAPSARGNR